MNKWVLMTGLGLGLIFHWLISLWHKRSHGVHLWDDPYNAPVLMILTPILLGAGLVTVWVLFG